MKAPSTFAMGHALKTIRIDLELSVEDVTKAGGWASKSTLTGWELGNRYPNTPNLYRLAEALQTTPQAILTKAEQIEARQ